MELSDRESSYEEKEGHIYYNNPNHVSDLHDASMKNNPNHTAEIILNPNKLMEDSPAGVVTRTRKGRISKGKKFINPALEQLLAEAESSDAINKETFGGVVTYMNRRNISEPVIVIIKNLKNFPPEVLNDLIHLMSKYREDCHIKFNLMIGIQNSNMDDLHLRLSIKSCIKLRLQRFDFPSMRAIIYEAIYKLIMSKESLLTFDRSVGTQLIEHAQIFGLSIEKFKRMCKILLAEFVKSNSCHFVLNRDISCLKEDEWAESKADLEREIKTGLRQ